ncbi:Protein no-on-transient A, partial [Tetrabaena socialis]
MSLWGCEELYVTGLPGDVTEPELRGLFGAHGTVKEAVIVNKKGPSAPGAPQSCIVRMSCHPDAVRAKKMLHKYDWMGKQISVKWSHNQRVIWVTNLHESVTNEVLFAAFSQFGAVSKAVVACDAPNNTSKGWGFVSFENKRFAVKAIEGLRERPFLVAAGLRPVVADWARNEEVLEGFSEEVKSGNKAPAVPPPPVPPESAARFPQPNTKEGMQGGRLLALRAEYEDMRRVLKMRMAEAENQIMHTTNHQLLGAGHSADRFNPNPNAQLKAEPQAPPQQPPPPAAQRPSAAFVRGGELHTVAQNGEQQQQQQPAQHAAGAAAEHAHAEGTTAPPAAGAKPAGSHNHGGIGFAGPPEPPAGTAPAKTPAGGAAVSPANAPYPTYDAPGLGGRAPYTAYHIPYGTAQQGQQQQAAAPPPQMGAYGVAGAPPPPPPAAQQQQPMQQMQPYGMYGAPAAQQQQQPMQQAAQQQQPMQQAAAQQQPYPQAATGAYPPPDQQQQQQYAAYSAYNNYNYYQ